jgi:TolB-like protein
MSFFAELRRRNVIRMAGLYLVASWLIVQVAETLLPAFDIPGWALRAIILVLALGFLPALVFAWVFEMTPEGLKRDSGASAAASLAPQTGHRLDRALIVVMALSLGYFAVDKFILTPAAETGSGSLSPVASAGPGLGAKGESEPEPVSDPSIAVLPFVNMSSDPEQEFFSDGLSEELLNQLAQIPQLRVIARTSSFSFKGKEMDVASIAKVLDVGHILEGSVRKSGDTLRITAQLIRASDSSHLWSKTYDRQLTDVFAIQDEISNEVVSALKLTLLPNQTLPATQRTRSVEAYEHYLRGHAALQRGALRPASQAAADLQRALDIDPNYANAWADLSFAQTSQAELAGSLAERNALLRLSEASADRAIELAPDLDEGYGVRSGYRFYSERDWTGARADFERALELSPNRADWLIAKAYFESMKGRASESIALARKATELDPLSGYAWDNLGQVLFYAGDSEQARKAWQRSLELAPDGNWPHYYMGYTDLQAGELDRARIEFQRADGGFPATGVAMIEFSRGNEAASQAALAELKRDYGAGFAYQVAGVYAWRGELDAAFEWLGVALDHRDSGMLRMRVDPTLAPLRADPRFSALAKRMNYPE